MIKGGGKGGREERVEREEREGGKGARRRELEAVDAKRVAFPAVICQS